jgi:hypothetical protein
MRTRLCVTLAFVVLAGLWASTSKGERNLSLEDMARIRGGEPLEDHCCRPFYDCLSFQQVPCDYYPAMMCDSTKKYHEVRPGQNETCTYAMEFDDNECEISTETHTCLIKWSCGIDLATGLCDEKTFEYPFEEVTDECDDNDCLQ